MFIYNSSLWAMIRAGPGQERTLSFPFASFPSSSYTFFLLAVMAVALPPPRPAAATAKEKGGKFENRHKWEKYIYSFLNHIERDVIVNVVHTHREVQKYAL